jgi:hypothetical protein
MGGFGLLMKDYMKYFAEFKPNTTDTFSAASLGWTMQTLEQSDNQFWQSAYAEKNGSVIYVYTFYQLRNGSSEKVLTAAAFKDIVGNLSVKP